MKTNLQLSLFFRPKLVIKTKLSKLWNLGQLVSGAQIKRLSRTKCKNDSPNAWSSISFSINLNFSFFHTLFFSFIFFTKHEEFKHILKLFCLFLPIVCLQLFSTGLPEPRDRTFRAHFVWNNERCWLEGFHHLHDKGERRHSMRYVNEVKCFLCSHSWLHIGHHICVFIFHQKIWIFATPL